MKTVLTLLFAAVLLSISGKSFEEELDQVETWLNKTYKKDSLAYKSVRAKLESIFSSSKKEPEKIAELHKEFPKAFPADAEEKENTAKGYFEKATEYAGKKNYEEAAKWLKKAAGLGDPNAQYNLGVCYYSGQGVPQDFEEAAKWFRMAADQEFPAAQYNLGLCYATGKGVKKNRTEAVKWFRRAADLGNISAQKALKRF